jgi:hypothetical protein
MCAKKDLFAEGGWNPWAFRFRTGQFLLLGQPLLGLGCRSLEQPEHPQHPLFFLRKREKR